MRHPRQAARTQKPPPRSPARSALITGVSLIAGVLAFLVVSRLVGGVPSSTPAEAAGTPVAKPAASDRKASTSRSRTPAAGEQLRAKAPLNKVSQDQGSSIALPDGRTLWIFADTFQKDRSPSFFVTSSVATTEPGGRVLSYATHGGVPTEFLPRTKREHKGSRDGVRYTAVWPVGSTLLPDGRVIIAYAKYNVTVRSQQYEFLGSGLFAYRYRSAKALHKGAVATRIADDMWAAYDGEVRSPVYADGFVYFSQCQDLKCYSLRTTPQGLTDRLTYRWWTGSGWSAKRSDRAPVTIGSAHPGGNASVVRLSTGGYAMADTEVGAPSPYGYLWVAPRAWGPWSRAASFVMPNCGSRGCYGLNLHPTQSTGTLLRLSYSTVIGPYVRVTDIPVTMAADRTSVSVR
ncbi:hypothetical protein ACIB24_14200 [Spongisporangium articulatum]|uniref:DUF4185 domain-containing protein n=1 Tax=Spongisporangium articulatum TaxID=3362603 RepID=A0ABW8ARH6_9ACTN